MEKQKIVSRLTRYYSETSHYRVVEVVARSQAVLEFITIFAYSSHG